MRVDTLVLSKLKEHAKQVLSGDNAPDGVCGWLVGSGASEEILSAIPSFNQGRMGWSSSDLESVKSFLPVGLTVRGTYSVPADEDVDGKLNNVADASFAVLKRSHTLVISGQSTPQDGVKGLCVQGKGKVSASDVALEDNVCSSFVSSCVTVSLTHHMTYEDDKQHKSFKSHCDSIVEEVDGAMLFARPNTLIKDDDSRSCSTIAEAKANGAPASKGIVISKGKKGKGGGGKQSNSTSPATSGGRATVSLVFNSSKAAPSPAVGMAVTGGAVRFGRSTVGVVGYYPPSTPLSQVSVDMKSAFASACDVLVQEKRKNPSREPSIFHFQPPGYSHVIQTVLGLDPEVEVNGGKLSDPEPYLAEARLELHKRFAVPANRPTFRTTAAVSGDKNTEIHNNRLVNPHIGLKRSVTGGQLFLIDGSYDYYHYMQDNFDDNHWGCAYRSMQLICSWFQHQHYTEVDVPSHKEIQMTLVEAGDKEAKFVGSRQWIGSFEISICLDSILDVPCKIMTLTNIHELPEKARELSIHFQTHGTPVMMGGGQYAYTMLGIDWNSDTGDIKCLIADPHFTGKDDLSTIQGRWVGWKGLDFFDQTSFYNLCLPQRPRNCY